MKADNSLFLLFSFNFNTKTVRKKVGHDLKDILIQLNQLVS